MYLISLLLISNLDTRIQSLHWDKKKTTNKKQTVIAFCSLCRKLGKSILHGAQNPVICVVVLFISTEPTDIREKYMRVFGSSLSLLVVYLRLVI